MIEPTFRTHFALASLLKQGGVELLLFWGHRPPLTGVDKSCLSQWFPAPFTVAGITFSTAEHWMMYQKAVLFGDESTAKEILLARTPYEAKQLGRKVRGFRESVWMDNRFKLVIEGNIHKFEQNPEMLKFLLSTGDACIVEASPVDDIWGIGMSQNVPAAYDPEKWRGLNLLGYALNEVRKQLRAKEQQNG